jgi:hypothetical protein
MRRHALLIPLAALATPALAAGFDLPPRAPGQWEMTISNDAATAPPQVIRMCLDPETDKALNAKFGGMASAMCSRQEQKKEGETIVLESECRIGDMRSASRTEVKGDFNTAYTMTTKTEMSGSNAPQGVRRGMPEGPTSQTTTIEAKRVGDCAAGFKPGDMDLGGGRTINVRDMPDPKPMQ